MPASELCLPFAMVINTDESKQPGKHWVAMFFPRFAPAEYYGRILSQTFDQNEFFQFFHFF